MKKLLFILLFLPTLCFGQTKQDLFYLIDKFPVDKSGNIDFCITDSLKNVSKESLHVRAIQAINYFFKDSPSPIMPVYNETNDMIIYRGRFGRYERTKKTFSSVLNTYIYRFTLKIEYEDNWYKIDFYDISESIENITTDLSDLLNKDYYNKARLTASSLKTKYNSILFIYNYLTNKTNSIDEYMKQVEKKTGK
ncbi:hypothetical protein [uncultured Bacteroides sp.]|uniref:hypothetical protein n=1 Tax=uncultured Bacteroides sp. TaxID=162156 RepID=UPI002AAB714D|nr:hypothetical protein [uncultured Bacteroides sp.]